MELDTIHKTAATPRCEILGHLGVFEVFPELFLGWWSILGFFSAWAIGKDECLLCLLGIRFH